VLDIRGVRELNEGGTVCQMLHKRSCPCAAFPTDDDVKTLDDYVPRYHQALMDLVDSKRYDGRPDFTVVIQPFMAKTRIPRTEKHEIDYSYFAPDCFHFSGKGHAMAALSLWNNMFEPVGGKQMMWHMGEDMKCPTAEHPYIFTSQNSAKALESLKRSTTAQVISANSTNRALGEVSIGSTTATTATDSTSHRHHKRPKHKDDKDLSINSKLKYAAMAGFILVILFVLILAIRKRQQINIYVREKGRRNLDRLSNPPYVDDSDDVEIWTRPSNKSALTGDDGQSKTLGHRITFD